MTIISFMLDFRALCSSLSFVVVRLILKAFFCMLPDNIIIVDEAKHPKINVLLHVFKIMKWLTCSCGKLEKFILIYFFDSNVAGFHQCRWGYHNLSVVEDVVENYKKAQIPLDVIWNDDDHMDGHKDFTLNPVNYSRPKLLAFLDKIHSIGMKYIVIIDPRIGVNSTYGVYQRGIVNDVFIKYHDEPYLAQVWPLAVNFLDFLNPKTVA